MAGLVCMQQKQPVGPLDEGTRRSAFGFCNDAPDPKKMPLLIQDFAEGIEVAGP